MITSSNNISLSSAQQKDKFVIVGGKNNLVVDSRGKVYPMGGVAPSAAPSAEVITGGGSLTPNIGYSYAYTYFNEYQDSETEPSPCSAYIGREDEGSYVSMKFSEDGLVIYVSGSDLRKEDEYYKGQTIACEIVNDEYVNVYSQWQYRSVAHYEYDNVNDLGKFTLNRPFTNVDPDEADQKYRVKIEDLESETGVVGGKSKGKDKLVLDPSASQTPSDYRFKTIHIVSGRGKGQKRIIMDAAQREDGLVEITVDSPWKEKPKFVDLSDQSILLQREQAEKQGGTKRGKNFYNRFYSSEYVITDPLRYNGYAIDANVISYDDKGRRVKLSGLGHSGDLLTGVVVAYKKTGYVRQYGDRAEVTVIMDGDSDSSSVDDTSTYANKRFRIYDGAGAGLDARIVAVVKTSSNRVTFILDVFGKLKKKDTPNATSKCVIYAGESVSSSMLYSYSSSGETQTSTIYPRVFNYENSGDEGNVELICLGYNGYIDSPYLCAAEATNAETYNNSRCYIMFKVKDKNGRKYYISRPIISAKLEEKTEADKNNGGIKRTYQQLRIMVNDLPEVNGERVKPYVKNEYASADTTEGADENTDYFVYADNLQDGYYTGWIAAFYNTSDNFAKGKKKFRTARVAGYLDATGELLLCNGVAGVGEGWQCVLYTEYARSFGSRVRPYIEDSYNPSYSSQTNSRYFLLDYFASSAEDYYKDWNFEFLYGTAKKVKGNTIYKQDKNKKQYTVFAYDGEKKRIDCAGDENFGKGVRMKPAPTGNEFVTLYDPSSYIFKIYCSDDEGENDENGEGSNASQDGIKMKVSGIVHTNLEGFNKIRLYRASESTETYRLCATLENKTQSYTDNTQESELTTQLDFAHAAPNPCAYALSRNARFALAGTNAPSFTADSVKGTCVALEENDGTAFGRKGIAYSSYDFDATVLHTAPMVGVNLSEDAKLEATLLNEGMADSLDLHLLIGKPSNTATGVMCSIEKRLEQSTIDNKIVDFIPSEYNTLAISAESNPPKVSGTLTPAPWYMTYRIPASYGDNVEYIKFGNVMYGTLWETYGFSPSFDPETRKVRIDLTNTGALAQWPNDPNLNWRLYIKAGWVEGTILSQNVTEFYLNPSAKNQDNAYDKATLKIADADGNPCYFKFGEDCTYDGKTHKVTLINGNTYKAKIKCVDLGDEYFSGDSSDKNVYAVGNTAWIFEPVSYGIYYPDFQLYYRSGTPYYFDGGAEHEITPVAVANNQAVMLVCPIPPLISNGTIKLTFGGNFNARIDDAVMPHTLYYVAVKNSYKDDRPLVSYALSDLSFSQRWDYDVRGEILDTEADKPYATVSSLEDNGKPANLYVNYNEDDQPVVTAKQLRQIIQGYNLLCLSKPNMTGGGNTTFFVKDNQLEIQITTAGAGLREKVELANVYNLNDGVGTKITGLANSRLGVIVFKDRGIYIIDPEKKALQYISHEFGCIAPKTIAEGRGGVFWLSNGGRIEYQSFDNGTAVDDIGFPLRSWFDGDVTLDGNAVDWNRMEAEAAGTYDADYGDYIIAIPCKKNNANTTVILAWNETFRQWWRIEDVQSHNSAKHAFRYEGRAAFAGAYGIFDFKPDKSVINPWKYCSRWRYEGADDTEKLLKRVYVNSKVDSTITSNPTATMEFYKNQKEEPEKNFVAFNSNTTKHTFYTNQAKAVVESGVRCFEWRFVMEGTGYVHINGIDLVFRRKEDEDPEISKSPYNHSEEE